MTGTISYRGLRPQQRVAAHSLFGQTMGYVAATGYTMFDFQRLRRNGDVVSAPFLAASIFLDMLPALVRRRRRLRHQRFGGTRCLLVQAIG